MQKISQQTRDLPPLNDEDLAAEYHRIQLQMKELEARKSEIAEHFKTATGDRVFGEYLVSVRSLSKEIIDGDAVRALLGSQTPMKASLQVQLSVKRLTLTS